MRRASGGVSLALIALLAACGGGGGGGSSSGGGGNSPGAAPLQYSGNSDPAVFTAGNATVFVGEALGDGGTTVPVTAGIAGPAAASRASGPGLAGIARRLNRSLGTTRPNGSGAGASLFPAAATSVDRTDPCDSGTVRSVGTLNDNGTGTISVTYNDCRTGSETVSGSATIRIDAYDSMHSAAVDYTVTFSRLSLRGPQLDMLIGGSLRSQTDFNELARTMTQNTVTLDNLTRRMSKAENLVIIDSFNVSSAAPYTEKIAGRMYDSVHGYVDIATEQPAPFFFNTETQQFPDAGRMVITDSGGRHIRVSAISSQRVRVQLDLDGNGAYELEALLDWTDLSGPVGADLGDSDGDGMHNSWETVHGLNPSDPSDASLDRDADGASNKAEYLAGTDPTSPASAPPAAGLSVTLQNFPTPIIGLGSNVGYSLMLGNSSAATAVNVVVTHTLSPGLTLVSVTTPRGSCSGTGPVIVCNLGSMFAFETLAMSLSATTTATGVVSTTAMITSGTPDPDLTNNSVTVTTTVGTPSGSLQARITAAAPGDTLVVDPGLYVGSLNFNGKNITLQSRDGPATTLIADAEIRMGPGGALRGFTMVRGLPSSVSAVTVSGAGSVISGNIFDGIVLDTGGSAAAIGGNTASPIIERNIFRNNNCERQAWSGAVTFSNASAPQIVNNVFQNNRCAAVNLLVSGAGSALVQNNDFVGNSVGVRVDGRFQAPKTLRNNIFAQNGAAIFMEFGDDSAHVAWASNLLFGNTADFSGTAGLTGTGNLSADPRFVDAAAGNYRLDAGSPAIDAGSATGAPAVDFDGVARPRGAAVDIGAFEK